MITAIVFHTSPECGLTAQQEAKILASDGAQIRYCWKCIQRDSAPRKAATFIGTWPTFS
jgi:hypothetical protein